MYISPSNENLMKLKNYSIHPAVYFIVASLLIAYFFPREGKFRYQFYEGKPWRYGLLTAPSDFPIYKTDAEVDAEKDSVLKNFEPYFRMDAGRLYRWPEPESDTCLYAIYRKQPGQLI